MEAARDIETGTLNNFLEKPTSVSEHHCRKCVLFPTNDCGREIRVHHVALGFIQPA